MARGDEPILLECPLIVQLAVLCSLYKAAQRASDLGVFMESSLCAGLLMVCFYSHCVL